MEAENPAGRGWMSFNASDLLCRRPNSSMMKASTARVRSQTSRLPAVSASNSDCALVTTVSRTAAGASAAPASTGQTAANMIAVLNRAVMPASP
jgi:hypothetical protein